jgi:hypothetical protein
LSYRKLLEIRVPLDVPRGIATFQDGTLCVCGDRSLLVLDRKAAVKARYSFPEEPACVAVGPGGRIYVGMPGHVEVLEKGAASPVPWPDLGPQAIITSIAAVGDAVFVADAGNRMVVRFDARGKLTSTISDGFVVPSPSFDLAAAPDGTLWVANPGAHCVRHYSAAGRLLGTWGASSPEIQGFAGCCNPVHLAVLPCGAVVTSEKGFPRVKVYEQDGALTAVVAAPKDFRAIESGLDLATRKANGGEILVLVPGERVVRVYAHAGEIARE